MGFVLLHLSTYLPILELKIVCPIWHLFRFTKVAISKSNFCRMWENLQSSNSANFGLIKGCQILRMLTIILIAAIFGKNLNLFCASV